jgi:putative membrane protein
MQGMWEWMGPVVVLMWLVGATLIIALIAGIVFAVRALTDRDRRPARAPEEPLGILEERYARGEIDRDEFIERRDTLRDPR